ncbi:hypothetical protein [Planococcus alpniumensis]|uniref:hypothetical protein n=1 Tax=Planococcus alpniumensis TaxID=2708345 RepID=UPI001B8B8F9B|nr:hypothetical protein [Planococcus sp. MSAK28401]
MRQAFFLAYCGRPTQSKAANTKMKFNSIFSNVATRKLSLSSPAERDRQASLTFHHSNSPTKKVQRPEPLHFLLFENIRQSFDRLVAGFDGGVCFELTR